MAAVSISGPTSRITQQSVPGIAEHLMRCCREISASLGVRERRRPHAPSPFLQHYGL